MKLRTFFALHAVVLFGFGIALALAPGKLLAQYGITLSEGATLVARLFGDALLGFGVLVAAARSAPEQERASRAIVLALLVGNVLGFVIALHGELSGAANALGWSTVAIYLLFACGYGYFQLKGPSASP